MNKPLASLAGLTVALLALHEALAYGLDRAELIERLLSPGDPSVIVALFLGVAFFALRLGVLFVLPGAWLYALVFALRRALETR